jgi:hypothetical protein
MKSDAISEMIFNTLKHEFQDASETRLLELARQLQEAQTSKLRRVPREAPGGLPPISKQKLSKAGAQTFLSAKAKSARAASTQGQYRHNLHGVKKSKEVSAA